jgi:hypothetical protein
LEVIEQEVARRTTALKTQDKDTQDLSDLFRMLVSSTRMVNGSRRMVSSRRLVGGSRRLVSSRRLVGGSRRLVRASRGNFVV